MERIDERIKSLVTRNGCSSTCPLMRPRCVRIPIKATRPASRSNRPDTYQRLPLSTHNLSCETQPVRTFGTQSGIGVCLADHLSRQRS